MVKKIENRNFCIFELRCSIRSRETAFLYHRNCFRSPLHRSLRANLYQISTNNMLRNMAGQDWWRSLAFTTVLFASTCTCLPATHPSPVVQAKCDTISGNKPKTWGLRDETMTIQSYLAARSPVSAMLRQDGQVTRTLRLKGGSSHAPGLRSVMPDQVSSWLEDNLSNESRKELGYTCLGLGATLFVLVCIPLPIIGIFMNRLGKPPRHLLSHNRA